MRVDLATQNLMQEIFNVVVTSLRAQGKPARVPERVPTKPILCYYRMPDDPKLKCAFGQLIHDADYRETMEGRGAASVLRCFDFPNSPLLDQAKRKLYPHVLNLLGQLQSTHDQSRVDEWEYKWADIAHQYNLTVPPK